MHMPCWPSWGKHRIFLTGEHQHSAPNPLPSHSPSLVAHLWCLHTNERQCHERRVGLERVVPCCPALGRPSHRRDPVNTRLGVFTQDRRNRAEYGRIFFNIWFTVNILESFSCFRKVPVFTVLVVVIDKNLHLWMHGLQCRAQVICHKLCFFLGMASYPNGFISRVP